MDSIPCIKCGESGYVGAMLDTGELYCKSCDGEFTVDEVEDTIKAWSQVLPWLKSHPALQK